MVRQPKKPLGALAAPIEVQVDQSKAEADKNMAEMIIRLRERNNINLLQCFINHKSFSQSVENLFVLSFLVIARPTLSFFALVIQQPASSHFYPHALVRGRVDLAQRTDAFHWARM